MRSELALLIEVLVVFADAFHVIAVSRRALLRFLAPLLRVDPEIRCSRVEQHFQSLFAALLLLHCRPALEATMLLVILSARIAFASELNGAEVLIVTEVLQIRFIVR